LILQIDHKHTISCFLGWIHLDWDFLLDSPQIMWFLKIHQTCSRNRMNRLSRNGIFLNVILGFRGPCKFAFVFLLFYVLYICCNTIHYLILIFLPMKIGGDNPLSWFDGELFFVECRNLNLHTYWVSIDHDELRSEIHMTIWGWKRWQWGNQEFHRHP